MSAAKPEWAMSTRERRRAVLLAAGLAPRPRRWLYGIATVLLLGGGLLVVAQVMPAPGTTEIVDGPAAPQAALLIHPLDVVNVAPQTLRDTLRVSGSVAPRQLVQLNASAAGTVDLVNVRLGDQVRRGDVLAQINIEALTIQLNQHRGTLEATRAQVELAESQVERSGRLSGQGIATEATLETDRRNLEVQKANLAAQQAAVEAAEVALRNATIVAPFDGIVASRDVEPGQVVANGANILQLVDLSTMSMTAMVPVSGSPAVAPGQAVTLSIDGIEGQSFIGHVEGVSPTTLAGTRSTPVAIRMDNADGALRGGMFASGQIVLDQVEQAIGIPVDAVIKDGAGSFVLKVVGGKVERQPVQTGRLWSGGALVQITDGLAAGDKIIARPLRNLSAGMAVQLTEV